MNKLHVPEQVQQLVNPSELAEKFLTTELAWQTGRLNPDHIADDELSARLDVEQYGYWGATVVKFTEVGTFLGKTRTHEITVERGNSGVENLNVVRRVMTPTTLLSHASHETRQYSMHNEANIAPNQLLVQGLLAVRRAQRFQNLVAGKR